MSGGAAGTTWATVAASLLWDVALPFASYLALTAAGWSAVAALAAAGAVALVRAAVVRLRTGVLGALPLLLCGKFTLGVAAALITGDARLVLAKDALVTACLGVVFLATLLARRPAIYHVRRGLGGDPSAWAARWEGSAEFRALHRRMTATWGVVLLGEATLRVLLAVALPLDVAALVVPLLGAVSILALVAWTQGAASRAATTAVPGRDPVLTSTASPEELP